MARVSGVVETQVLHQLHAAHLRHHHIGEDQIIGMGLDRRQGLLPVAGGVHQVAGRNQNILYQLQDSRFIVHYENDRLLFHSSVQTPRLRTDRQPSHTVLFGYSPENLTLILRSRQLTLARARPIVGF